MPITLADVQQNTASDIDYNLIDETRRQSFLLNLLPFDDIVTPGTAGGTLTFGYTRLKDRRAADTRQENTEYPARKATKQRVTGELVPMGARYNIDRVYANLGDALTNEVIFQQGEARTATVAKFHDLFINGVSSDFTTEVPEFDGLDAIVTGTTTESLAPGDIAWDFDTINTREQAAAVNRALRAWLRNFSARPSAFFVNKDGAAFLDTVNDMLSATTRTQDDFGQDMSTWGGIPYLDLGEKDGTAEEIIATEDGVTSIYAAVIGLDSVHGITTRGGNVMKSWLPDFTTAGAVKPGEVELGPVAIAAKRTKGVGAFRVKVA